MGAPRQIRIQSDGTSLDTVITDADGKSLDYIKGATVYLGAGDVNLVNLELAFPAVDIHATPQDHLFICVCCGETVTHSCSSTL